MGISNRRKEREIVAAAAAMQARGREVQTLSAPRAVPAVSVRFATCQWFIGDPDDGDAAKCGRKCTHGAYCLEHYRVAYIKPRQSSSDLLRLGRAIR